MRRNVFAAIISGIMLSSLSFGYSGGDGTADHPYQIADANDLLELAATTTDYSKYFIMTSNIDLAGVTVTPVGNSTTPFIGNFNGNGHTISNLTITSPTQDYIGLFGYIGTHQKFAWIANIGMLNVYIQGRNNVGGLIGSNHGSMIISCYATGSVNGSGNVGGLVGNTLTGIYNGNPTNCYATSTVSGYTSVGGLVGWNSSMLTSCYATGAVTATGSSYVGGLAGMNQGAITSSYATGAVTATGSYSEVGGLVGKMGSNTGTITFCYATGTVTATGSYSKVGGLVGDTYSTNIISSFWDTETSGQMTSAGGIGKTTAEMKSYSMYISAGWDFLGETANGTADIWTMTLGSYPILSWQISSVEYSGGKGTEEDPYQIATKADLLALAVSPIDYDKWFILTENIDLVGETFTAAVIAPNMGNEWSGFEGPAFTGVFNGNDKKINNLVIRGTSSDYVGLFGCIGPGGQIKNIDVVNAFILGRTCVGGLVGYNYGGTIISCYAKGTVGGYAYVGGLVGVNGDIFFCNSIITSCYATSDVIGSDDSCFLGGLCGMNGDGCTINNCYAMGSVIGRNGSSGLGGLVGWNYSGSITYCYAAGAVTGSGLYSDYFGGLVSYNDSGEVKNSFWDTEISGLTTSAGGTGKTTSEMKTLSTFTSSGWDFSIPDGKWKIPQEGENFPQLIWQSIIESPTCYVIFPKEVGNGGLVTVSIVAMPGTEAFAEGMTARLAGEGIPDISAQSVRIVSSQIMEVDFDLTEAPLGNRSVVIIEDPNTQPANAFASLAMTSMSSSSTTGTGANAGNLNIVPSVGPYVITFFEGPTQVRIGRPANFELKIRTLGNYNAENITTWLTVPSSIGAYSLNWTPLGVPPWRTKEEWNQNIRVSKPIASQSPYSLPFTVETLSVDVPADTSLVGQKLKIKVGANTEAAVRSELKSQGYIIKSYPDTQVTGLLNSTITLLKDFASGFQNGIMYLHPTLTSMPYIVITGGSEPHLGGGWFNHVNGYKTDFRIRNNVSGETESESGIWVTEYIQASGASLIPFSQAPYQERYCIDALSFAGWEVANSSQPEHWDCSWGWDGNLNVSKPHYDDAGGHGGNQEEIEIEIVGSMDPSDVYGPLGEGEQRWIQTHSILPYTIIFENEPNATAPAADVVINNYLDPQTFDLSTVMLGSIKFQGKTATPTLLNMPPVGMREFSADVDLRPEMNLIIRVHCKLDMSTGLLVWTFNSLDPDTLQLPDDPMAGFLPAGESGQVSYGIMPKATLPTGYVVKNSAAIVFDVNPPYATSVWKNTVDNIPPTSTVLPLPADSASPTFAVEWVGHDDPNGSRIKDFDIYVSVDGNDFTPWQVSTNQTRAEYTGVAGHTYAFRSKARDIAINVEAAHTQPDAVTTVVVDNSNIPPIANAGQDVSIHCGIDGMATVQLDGSGSSDADNDTLTYWWNWTIDDQSYTTEGATPIVQLPLGTHEITLIVNDGTVDSEPNTVAVTVYNTLPLANAGLDISIHCGTDGTAVVQLDGSGSLDMDNDLLSYHWNWTIDSQSYTADGATPTVQLPLGTHEIALIVSDGIANSEPNTVAVTVYNTLPLANAGLDISIHCGTDGTAAVQLDGSGSTDPDNDPLTYLWSWTIDSQSYSADGVTPTIQLPPGTYEIALIVNDGITDSQPDTVTVTVYSNIPPIANAGPDQTVYAWIDGVADVTLDGSGSNDPDGDELTYKWNWTVGGNTYDASSVTSAIELPVGQHVISLIVNDGTVNSELNEVVITVVGPIEANLNVMPKTLNSRSNIPKIMTNLLLPKGITKDQIDTSKTFLLYPGQIQADWSWFSKDFDKKCKAYRTTIFASFDKDELMDAISDNGQVELVVVGQLKTGQYFYGTDTVTVISPGKWPKHRPWYDHRWDRRCKKWPVFRR